MNNSKSIINLLVVVGLMFLGIVMAVSVTTNAAGGLAALVPLIGGILTLFALVNPRGGLFALAALVIWVDEFKRLAVYFGGAYSTTVYQTLAMPFIVLAALNTGFLLNMLFGKVKIDTLGIVFYALATLVGGTVFFTMEGTTPERVQRAANLTGYITLIPIAYTYLKSFDDWRKFFGFQCIVALPAAAWAIKQYYYGFDQIEWTYAESGLSAAHFNQMFKFENPRVFGFFGSASSLGCVAVYCAFSWWHAFANRKWRFLWLFIAMIFSVVLVCSTQRSALIYPIIITPFIFLFRRPLTTVAAYATGAVIFISGVIFADYLLEEGLDKINEAIAVDSGWGQKVLVVSTFSDRLRGWSRLSKASSYSLFGTEGAAQGTITEYADNYNHDVINKILINYGVVGVLAIAIPGLFAVSILHKTIFNQQTTQLRNNAAFALALTYPMILLSFVGGDNFNANPINIQLWTGLAGVFVCRSQSIAGRRKAKQDAWEMEQERIRAEREALLLEGN